MENRGGIEWIDEDFDEGEKYTEEFIGEWRVEGWESTSFGVPSLFGVVSNKQGNGDTSEAQE